MENHNNSRTEPVRGTGRLSRAGWLAVVLAVVLAACSGDSGSPEDQIRQYVERGVEAAENRSVDKLGELVHANYRDQRGYNKKRLAGMLQGYFFRHKNIHLFTRIDEIDLFADNQAVVVLHLAMAGSVISDIDAVSRLAARLYRLELHLVREDGWLLQHAKWAPAKLSDLQ